MVFNDTADRNGFIQECERICRLGVAGISGNANLLKDFTVRLNSGIDRFYTLAFQFDKGWTIDDTNSFATQPTYLDNLVSGTQEYLVPSTILYIDQVFAKDSTGTWHELLVQDDVNEPNTFLTTVSGQPSKYKLHGNYILLDNVPNYSSTNGLKIIYKRTGGKFTYNAPAQTSGIPTVFDEWLANYAAYPYISETRLSNKLDVKQKIMEGEERIRNLIANRARGKHSGLKIIQQNNR